jgi:hypothetical protein
MRWAIGARQRLLFMARPEMLLQEQLLMQCARRLAPVWPKTADHIYDSTAVIPNCYGLRPHCFVCNEEAFVIDVWSWQPACAGDCIEQAC